MSCKCGHKIEKDLEDLNRQLQIKLNVLKRCKKEHESYHQEAQAQEKRIQELEADGNDEYTLNKQRQVLGESQRMIPECSAKVEQAEADLRAFITHHPNLHATPLGKESLNLLQ